jgi:hypothetical protein
LGQKLNWAAEVEGGCGGRAEEIRRRQQTSSVGPKVATGRKWGKEKEKGFFLFSENIFVKELIWKLLDNSLKPRKNILKIPKIPGKFPEPHWDMNNPNKLFGAH